MVSTYIQKKNKSDSMTECREWKGGTKCGGGGGIKKQGFRNVNKGCERRWREVENMKV
jgi:hypothetical protein